MNIVFDTNIYLASVLSRGGLCFKIIELAMGQGSAYQVFISSEIWQEFETVILKKNIGNKNYILSMRSAMEERAFWVTPKERIELVKRDPSDNKILECAAACQADLIVTMDKDLLKFKRFRTAGIVHPKILLYMLPERD